MVLLTSMVEIIDIECKPPDIEQAKALLDEKIMRLVPKSANQTLTRVRQEFELCHREHTTGGFRS